MWTRLTTSKPSSTSFWQRQRRLAAPAFHRQRITAMGRLPAAADCPALPFTRAVVDETLRLHPRAYLVNRRVAADDVVCGIRIRRGGAIVLSPLILHRHPTYWEHPDDFLPERWADPAAEERRPKFAYLPFSGGPRRARRRRAVPRAFERSSESRWSVAQRHDP